MSRKKYNGWTNYETWCVSFWLNNEYHSHHWLSDLANEDGEDYHKAETLKVYVSEDCNPLVDTATMFTDLLNGALSEVNWIEIIKSAKED